MKTDFVDRIIALETGELSDRGTVTLFRDLANNGLLFQLQGTYQRGLKSLMEQGYIKRAKTGRYTLTAKARTL